LPLAPFAKEKRHNPNAGSPLRDDGSPSRPLDAHVKGEDKERVEGDIQNRTDKNRKHTRHRFALSSDKKIHPQSQHDENGANRVNLHVIVRVTNRFVAAAKSQQKRLRENQKQSSKDNAEDNEQDKGIAFNPFGLFLFALTRGNQRQRSTTRAHQVSESGDGNNQRRANT